jgi:hypothetical protein
MSLDAGMVGKTIKVGVAKVLEDAGTGADLTATLTAEIPRRNGGLARRLTWSETGNQWHSSPTTKTVAAGEEVTFPNVPPTNSAGWRLDGVTPSLGATGHVFTYTLTMQATVAGQRLTLLSESFVLPEDAPDEIDADTLIEASASSGATINIVDQWSGLVAAAQAAAAAAAASVGTVVTGVSTALAALDLPADGVLLSRLYARIVAAADVDAYVAQLEATLPPGTPYTFMVRPFDIIEGITP